MYSFGVVLYEMLTGGHPACKPGTQDFVAPNTNYTLRFQLMHQMIVLAMQCGLTNVATIMYGPGVSGQDASPKEVEAPKEGE